MAASTRFHLKSEREEQRNKAGSHGWVEAREYADSHLVRPSPSTAESYLTLLLLMSSHRGLINLCITMTSLLQTAKKAPAGGGHSLHRKPVRPGGGAQPEVAPAKTGKAGGPRGQ